MTSTDMVGDREPRYFWRRAFAFLLDVLVAQLVVSLVFAAVDGVAGTSLGDSLANSQSQCSPAPNDHPQVLRIESLWPLPAGWQRENIICSEGTGADQSWSFTTRAILKGETTYTKEVGYSIDKDGNALPTEYAPNFGPFAIVLFFIVLAANGWRTPGKAALSLRIKTTAGGMPDWGHAFRREVLKLMPIVSFGVIAVWVAVAPPDVLTNSEVSIIAMRDGTFLTSPWMLMLFAWCAGTIVWWFGPFVRWRDRTWYDALAGTKVVRSDLPAATARRRS
jgi:hypothetical protein